MRLLSPTRPRRLPGTSGLKAAGRLLPRPQIIDRSLTRRDIMASVSVTNARKSYGHFEVLHGVNIDISDGEFVILVGPSGCGKSTFLWLIVGLENITDGQIAIGAHVVNDVAPKERDIAMVFQSY